MKTYPTISLLAFSALIFSTNLNAFSIQFDGVSVYYGENPNILEIESHPNYNVHPTHILRNSLYDLNGAFTFSDTSGNIYDNLLSVDLNLTMYDFSEDVYDLNDFINVNFDTFNIGDVGQQIGTYSLDSHFGNNLVFRFDYSTPESVTIGYCILEVRNLVLHTQHLTYISLNQDNIFGVILG